MKCNSMGLGKGTGGPGSKWGKKGVLLLQTHLHFELKHHLLVFPI